ncbi:MAG: hypothetical protein J6Z12_02600 [Paludibacteraceae bacterium]|nr:hypothetical protein [Paludibacteraceae bacterium]
MRPISMRACLALLALTALPLAARAADDASINRSVTVEKDYVPTDIDADKINVVPAKETYTPDRPVVSYSTWSQSEEVTTTPGKIKSNLYHTSSEKDARKGVFRAGLGAYWQVLGEFYYPLLQGDKYLLDIDLQHHSDWGHIRYDDTYRPRAARHNTEATITFENQFKEARLSSAVDFSYNGFDYYGRPTTDTTWTFAPDTALTKGSYTTVGAHFDLFSTNSKKAFQYDFVLDYHYFGRNAGIHNNALDFGADMRFALNTGRLGLNIGMDGNFLGGAGIARHNTGLFTINPYYYVDGKDWQLRIGGKLFGLASDSVQGVRKWPVSGGADMYGLFGLVPGLFYLEAGLGSDFRDNNYVDILQENRYITPDLVLLPTYTPLDARLGIKIKVMEGLLFHVGGQYQLLLNEHYYVNAADTANRTVGNTFEVLYGKTTNRINVEAGLHYDAVKGLDLGVTARYNYWGVKDDDGSRWEHAWQKPAWEINFKGSYRFLEKWEVGLSYNFLAGRYARIGEESCKMKPLNDLNVWVTYKALDWLSVFVNGKNLINVKGDSFYGYRNFGINGMAGVTMTF